MNQNIKTSLGVIIILIIAGSVGVYVWNMQKTLEPVPTQNTQTQPVAQPAPVDKTANWKTYKNDKYGFEFKYPGSGYGLGSVGVGDENHDPSGKSITKWQDAPYVWVDNLPPTELSKTSGYDPFGIFVFPKDWGNQSQSLDTVKANGKKQNINYEEVMVSGQRALRDNFSPDPNNRFTVTNYIIVKDGVQYDFLWRSDNSNIGEKIFSTFNFTN